MLALNKFSPDTDEYDDFIIGLKGDPLDEEYSAALALEKAKAVGRKKLRGAKGRKDPDQPFAPSPYGEVLGADSVGRRSEHSERDDSPIIKGNIVSSDQILAAETEGQDPLQIKNEQGELDKESIWLKAFLEDRGLYLTEGTREALANTGEFVYIGNDKTTFQDTVQEKGGYENNRPVYLLADNAKAMVATLSQEKIKEYQARLGNPETGILDNDIIGIWDDAVEQAQRYAMSGRRVELQFIFESLIEQKAAEKSASGGGGGRTPLNDIDYYFAMMQVLGDISGVRSGG